MFRNLILTAIAFFILVTAQAQIKKFECNKKWVSKIENIAPAQPEVQPQKIRKVLVFDKFTGFDHWVTPHTSQVIRVLGEKSGAYETVISKELSSFEASNLEQFDAVVLNNNCSVGPRRNQIMDMLDEDKSLSEEQKKKKAEELENNLISFVKDGGGLMVIHGAIVMQNNSMAFSEMVGGSFDYHPPQQEVVLELADPDHPLVAAFNGEPFVHVDEPYLFKNAYEQKNFKPLLYMDSSKLKKTKKKIEEKIKYVSWIKRHGKGRVFYVSPSHNAQSFEDIRLLKFYLDGAQYVLGDYKCDDTPMQP